MAGCVLALLAVPLGGQITLSVSAFDMLPLPEAGACRLFRGPRFD